MAETGLPVAGPPVLEPEPLRVTYVIGSLGKGGAEYQLAELLRRLDRRRVAPTVVSLATGGHWAAAIRAMDVPVIEIPRRHRLEVRRLWRLREILHELRPTILHTILWEGNCYGRIAALGLGIPVVVAAERNVIRKPGWQRLVERLLDPSTTAYLTNADAIVDELVDPGGLPRAKMHVVHNGIDLDTLPSFTPERAPARRRLGFDADRRLVAQVGRLETQKDYPTYVAAMAMVAEHLPDVDFLIVGEGSERASIEAAVARAGLAERTKLLGLRHDVPALLAGVDVMVLASRFEGMPNVVLEAMATGAATVATDVGACRALLADGAGCLVPVGDPAAIAAAVRSLLEDHGKRQAVVERARRRVEDELSLARMASETFGFYDRLRLEAGA